MAVLSLWAVVAVLGGVLGGSVFDLARGPGPLEGAESTAVEQRRLTADPDGEQVVVVLSGLDALGSQPVSSMPDVIDELRAEPGVAEVRDPWTRGAYDLLSADRTSAVVLVRLDPSLDDDAALGAARRVVELLRSSAYPTVLGGGGLLAEDAFATKAVADSARGEGIALVVLLILLTAVLGGVLVGSLPLVTALAAIAASLLSLTGLATWLPVSEFAVNVVTVLGLGLCVDYSLLILSRYREEGQGAAGARRRPAPDLGEVLGATMEAAGRTVLVSGLTVASALAALLLLGDPVLTGMATGGLVAVLVATVAALTLMPALIGVAYARIPLANRRSEVAARARRRALLSRTTSVAQARPWATLVLGAGVLLLVALPLLSLEVDESDASSLPGDSEPRLAQEAVQQEHPDLAVAPLTVVAETAPDDSRLEALPDLLSALPGVAEREDVIPVDVLPDGSSRLLVVPEGTTSGARAQRLVEAVREIDAGFPLRVGGPAAEFVDGRDRLASRAPLALGAALLVTGLLVLALTRAPVVAAKTVLLAVLSLGATLGAVVAIFQWGWGSAVLGIEPGALDVTTPLLLIMFAFGLLMDYHVFLVSRIKEHWDARLAGSDETGAASRAVNDRAVRDGVADTGPVVTLAATALALVFLGFAAGELVEMKEVGVGMTVAIVLDVTIVRGLLLPAAMSLLGPRNWWWPRRPHNVPGHHN